MKKLRKAFMCLAMVCVCFFGILLSGCNESPMVISIEKTKTVGNVDTYTITYSDDSTFEFTVTNGVNGENGNDVSVQELYDYYTPKSSSKIFLLLYEDRKRPEDRIFRKFLSIFRFLKGNPNGRNIPFL